MKRIVVTGMGVVSPLGCTLEHFWDSLMQGDSGIGELTHLDSSPYSGLSIAAEVKGLEHVADEKSETLEKYSNAVYYASVATKSCLRDAGLPETFSTANNYGLIIGTTSGNQDMVERTINTFDITSSEEELSQEAAQMLSYFRPIELSSTVARACNLGGPNMVIPTACAAGNYAISTAYSMIQEGRTSMIIAGGADPFTRSCYTIFYRLGAMTQKDCRPFDQNRTGMVVGEGAAMLVLEELEHALARGAKIYGEVKGYGLSCDAYHPTAPDPEGSGAILAMEKALKASKLDISDVSYISAHGTGTKANDAHEAKAMHKVFGESLNNIPVNGLKSMTGHCMGAASALEAVAALLSIKEQVVPPTPNTELIDSAFEAEFTVNNNSDKREIKNVLSNSFAFGGNVCSVIFSQFNQN